MLTERIGALSGKVAVIRVGAPTNAELAELQHRVEDALGATRAAMAEGIVAGGGVALLHAAPVLDELDVVRRLRDGRARSSGGRCPSPRTSSPPTPATPGRRWSTSWPGSASDEGFDALQGRYGNMLEMGIIDPLRVCRSALQNGASVAGLLLTTNTLIAEEQTPWGGSRALMTEFGQLDEGLHQPSPDCQHAAVARARAVGGLTCRASPVTPAGDVPAGATSAGPEAPPLTLSTLEELRSKGRLRGLVALLGPAFVAAVAYVDPGNFATNIAAGARHGYALAWVVVMANADGDARAVPVGQGRHRHRDGPARAVPGRTSAGRSRAGCGCRPRSSRWRPTWPSSSAPRSGSTCCSGCRCSRPG